MSALHRRLNAFQGNNTNDTAASYHAFISYSHCDHDVAQWLHKSLEEFYIPRSLRGKDGRFGILPDNLYPIFLDNEELSTSSDLSKELYEALEKSNVLILLCSPESISSKWVNEEVRYFCELGREERVIAVLTPQACSLAEQSACFPTLLLREPLAVSIPSDRNKKAALLKIVAGLLGINFETIKKRHTAYLRRKRLTQASLLCLAGAAILTIAYIVAWSNPSSQYAMIKEADKWMANLPITKHNDWLLSVHCSIKGRKAIAMQMRNDFIGSIAPLEECKELIINRSDRSSRLLDAATSAMIADSYEAMNNSDLEEKYFINSKNIFEALDTEQNINVRERIVLIGIYKELSAINQRRGDHQKASQYINLALRHSQILVKEDATQGWISMVTVTQKHIYIVNEITFVALDRVFTDFAGNAPDKDNLKYAIEVTSTTLEASKRMQELCESGDKGVIETNETVSLICKNWIGEAGNKQIVSANTFVVIMQKMLARFETGERIPDDVANKFRDLKDIIQWLNLISKAPTSSLNNNN